MATDKAINESKIKSQEKRVGMLRAREAMAVQELNRAREAWHASLERLRQAEERLTQLRAGFEP